MSISHLDKNGMRQHFEIEVLLHACLTCARKVLSPPIA
jgi:hypothetical protein